MKQEEVADLIKELIEANLEPFILHTASDVAELIVHSLEKNGTLLTGDN